MCRTCRSLVCVVGLVNLASHGCGAKSSQRIQTCGNTDEVGAVLELLEESPDPSMLDDADRVQRRSVIVTLRRISQRDLYVIREAMRRYARRRERDPVRCDDLTLARLFVLNKYLFNCPERADPSEPGFGGWVGVPHDEEHANLMWPLSYDAQGRVVLTHRFGAYFGEPYAALGAFDYYRETYGRRPNTEAGRRERCKNGT